MNMKKLSFLAIAAMAMISCGNTYDAKTVVLTSTQDSLNYAWGFGYGSYLKGQFLADDSLHKAVDEVMAAFEDGYNGKAEETLSEAAEIGENLGQALKVMEKKGLAENQSWQLNEKMLLQGFVNGLYEDFTAMNGDDAATFIQTEYQKFMAGQGGEEKAAKAITVKKCMTKPAQVTLKTYMDSVNYAFGIYQGAQIKKYVLANDSDKSMEKELIEHLNLGLKSTAMYPHVDKQVQMMGKDLKTHEVEGFLGEESIEYDYELIKQGMINALSEMKDMMDEQQANEYLQTTMERIKYGDTKEVGKKWLAENAQRPEVQVTESGLQYEVITMGKGPKPAATDKVEVHYEGRLIDGTIFDSSYERGETTSFFLNQVIKGWTEGLQLMPVGSTFMLYIPYELGYGERGAGETIPPFSTLIFKVELKSIVK